MSGTDRRTFILPSSPRQMMVFTVREPLHPFRDNPREIGHTTPFRSSAARVYCFGNSQQVF